MAELHRDGDAEGREARDVRRRQALGVLDARPQTGGLPFAACLLERVERLAVGEVADRVYGDRQSRPDAPPDHVRKVLPARDLHARAVEHTCRPRAERAVHERLQVADADEVVTEAAADVERSQLVHLLGGE